MVFERIFFYLKMPIQLSLVAPPIHLSSHCWRLSSPRKDDWMFGEAAVFTLLPHPLALHPLCMPPAASITLASSFTWEPGRRLNRSNMHWINEVVFVVFLTPKQSTFSIGDGDLSNASKFHTFLNIEYCWYTKLYLIESQSNIYSFLNH